jgi:hypothetical protein
MIGSHKDVHARHSKMEAERAQLGDSSTPHLVTSRREENAAEAQQANYASGG